MNTRDLIEMLKEYEYPFASKEGHPIIAGGYSYLRPYELNFNLTAPEDKNAITILACKCGEDGCWPMVISVIEKDDKIIWKNFRQPHRGAKSKALFWDYSKFPEFMFDRGEYQKQLDSIKTS